MATSISPCNSIATADAIDALGNDIHPPRSGYRNVYFCGLNHDGEKVWHGKVKRGGRLMVVPGSRSTDRLHVVCRVAQWFADEYGPDWRRVLRVRKKSPVLVRRNPDGPGYYAVIWIAGKRHEVVKLARHPVRRRALGGGPAERWERYPNVLIISATRDEAKEEAWLYAVRLLGLLALTELYRVA